MMFILGFLFGVVVEMLLLLTLAEQIKRDREDVIVNEKYDEQEKKQNNIK